MEEKFLMNLNCPKIIIYCYYFWIQETDHVCYIFILHRMVLGKQDLKHIMANSTKTQGNTIFISCS